MRIKNIKLTIKNISKNYYDENNIWVSYSDCDICDSNNGLNIWRLDNLNIASLCDDCHEKVKDYKNYLLVQKSRKNKIKRLLNGDKM